MAPDCCFFSFFTTSTVACVCVRVVGGLGGGYFMDSIIENLESGLMNVSKHGTKCNLVLPDNKCLILLP